MCTVCEYAGRGAASSNTGNEGCKSRHLCFTNALSTIDTYVVAIYVLGQKLEENILRERVFGRGSNAIHCGRTTMGN